MIGIPLGIVYVNAVEWVVHKHVLHGLGRDKASRWSFHWHEHHKKARKHDMHDDQYTMHSVVDAVRQRALNAKTKEALGLIVGGLVHAPLLPVAPFFTLTVWASAANYYRVHRKAHLDPAWAEEKLPWHVDHHMGKNQDANWCVTWPLFDWVMGTREKFVGTEEHAAHRARMEARAAAATTAQEGTPRTPATKTVTPPSSEAAAGERAQAA